MITKDIIIVEDRFEEMFSYLPTINGFGVTFSGGDNKELGAFLELKGKAAETYPLIWLVYPYTEKHGLKVVELERISFILAVRTNKVMLNDQRIKETYKGLLIPLLKNIKILFDRANIISVNDEYSVVKFPNYSGDDNNSKSSFTTDPWDALKVTFSCSINSVCLRPIQF